MKVLQPQVLFVLKLAADPRDVLAPLWVQDHHIDQLMAMGYITKTLTELVQPDGQRLWDIQATPRGKLALRCHRALGKPD